MTESIFFQTENLIIYDLCYQSMPCSHHAIIDGKDAIYDSLYIYEIIKKRNIEIPDSFLKHFKDAEDDAKFLKEQIKMFD